MESGQPASTPRRPEAVRPEVVEVPLNILDISDRVRRSYDPESIERLGKTLQRKQLQPIRVQYDPQTKRCKVMSGVRRVMAAARAGRTHIQAIVVAGDLSPVDMLVDQLVESLHAEELKPAEEGAAFAEAAKRLGLNQAQLAELLGVSESRISRRLALLKFAPEEQAMIDGGQIGESTAYEIAKAPESKTRHELFHRAAEEGWSVDQARRAVDAAMTRRKSAAPSVKPVRQLRIPVGGGLVAVAAAGEGALTPEAVVEALSEALKAAKKAVREREGCDISRLSETLRERGKLLARSAEAELQPVS